MKKLYALLLAVAPMAASAQLVAQPGSAPTVAVNWRPLVAIDSLEVDLTGDARPDVVFRSAAYASTGPGMPSQNYFMAGVKRNSNVELALDANEYDSAHRFQAGDVIGPGLLWQNQRSAFLDYTLIGNGGTGGRGFFRYNASGFVVFRQVAGSQTRYWWFFIEPRRAATDVWISYYGGSSVALAHTPGSAAPAVQAFPNPSTVGWTLSAPAAYRLLDCRGQVVSSQPSPTTWVDGAPLRSGLYSLELLQADGSTVRRKLVKE